MCSWINKMGYSGSPRTLRKSKGETQMLTQLKHRFMTILLLCLFVATLFGCSLPGIDDSSDQQKSAPSPTPIIATNTPARILQYCADTYPLVPDSLFKSGTALVADMLDSSINVNE